MMKSRTTNCIECRKQVYKEAEEAYLKHEYAFFRDSARSFAVFAVCGGDGKMSEYVSDVLEADAEERRRNRKK